MLKNVIICTLFLALVASILFGVFKAYRNEADIKKVAIAERERDEARQAESMAIEALKLSRDSIDLAFTVAMNAKTDSRRSEIRVNQIQKQHETEKASFVVLPSDSVRLRKLAVHFPSVLNR